MNGLGIVRFHARGSEQLREAPSGIDFEAAAARERPGPLVSHKEIDLEYSLHVVLQDVQACWRGSLQSEEHSHFSDWFSTDCKRHLNILQKSKHSLGGTSEEGDNRQMAPKTLEYFSGGWPPTKYLETQVVEAAAFRGGSLCTLACREAQQLI